MTRLNKLQYKQDLEEIILSVMLNDAESITHVSEKIKPQQLTEQSQKIFLMIIDLAFKQTDLMLIAVKLNKEFGAKIINNIKDKVSVPTLNYLLTNNIINSFLDICFSLEVENFLESRLNELKSNCNGSDALESLNQDIQDLQRTFTNNKTERSFTENLPQVLDSYDKKRISSDNDLLSFNSIPSLSIATGGINKSNLVTIAGFTGQGKTFLSLNIALDLARQNIPIGYISLEQSEAEIYDRLIGMISGIESIKLRNPKRLNVLELKNLSIEKMTKDNLPLYINDRPMTEIEIKSKMKYWKDRFEVKVIFIDYLGLIKSKEKFTTRERELNHYSEFLKLAAKELDLIIVVLSQLNRSGKERPNIENLAESMGIARDSDFLFTIFKPIDIGQKSDDSGIKFNDSNFVLRCEKNRHNKNKKQILLKLKDSGEFIELATEYDKEIEQLFGSEVIKR